MKHVRPQNPIMPNVFTDNELSNLNIPTLLLVGEQEIICDPKAAVDRAIKLIANIEAGIILDASHILSMEQPEIVNKKILEFLARNP